MLKLLLDSLVGILLGTTVLFVGWFVVLIVLNNLQTFLICLLISLVVEISYSAVLFIWRKNK